jgi:hypothetical protein
MDGKGRRILLGFAYGRGGLTIRTGMCGRSIVPIWRDISRNMRSEKASGVAGFSDRVRLRALSMFGGIWADATLYCSQSIGGFINLVTQLSQFFAFSHPARDRLISSWFLASHPTSPIIQEWQKATEMYFDKLARNNIRTHTYFFVHYLFEYIMRRDTLSGYYAAMPKICVNGASRIHHKLNLDDIDSLDIGLTASEVKQIELLLNAASYHQQMAIKVLWDRLRPGGLFIIEDLNWQPPHIETKLPRVPTTAQLFTGFFEKGDYVQSVLLTKEFMERSRRETQIVSFFPDFRPFSSSKIKLMVLQKKDTVAVAAGFV